MNTSFRNFDNCILVVVLYLINGVQCNSFKRLETDSSNKGQAVTAVMFCKELTFLKKRPEKNFNKFLLFIRLFITNSSSVSHGLIVLHRNMKHTQNGARAVRGFRMRQMRHLPQTPIFEMPWGPPCWNVDYVLCFTRRFSFQFCFISMLQIHPGLKILSPMHNFLQDTNLQYICKYFRYQVYVILRTFFYAQSEKIRWSI